MSSDTEAPFPLRPRLADHTQARRKLGGTRPLVHLLDTRDNTRYELEEHDWVALSCADGTRDLDGIVLATAARGALRRVSELKELFESLHDAGLLADGTASPAPPLPAPPETPPDRPLDVLDFHLTCDGRGVCCRTYGSIAFSRADAQRAQVLVPDAHPSPWLFTPIRGSVEQATVAVSLVGGACAYLGEDGRCRVQAAGGAEAKPLGCRHYPATFVDDGERICVSLGLECACIARSAGAPAGSALVPPDAGVAADLPPGTRLQRLPPSITVAAGRSTDRTAFGRWSRARLEEPLSDVVERFMELGAGVEAGGLEEPFAAATVVDPSAERLVRQHVERIVARAREELPSVGRVTSRSTGLGLAWIAGATLAGAPHAARHDPVEELFYRATLHGRLAFAPSVAEAMLVRAAWVWLARAMSTLDGHPEARELFGHPLVAVCALVRVCGLDS